MSATIPDAPRAETPLLDDALEGHSLGRYEIVSELGSGGMATVYLGRTTGPHGFVRWFAIKRVHPHLAKDRSFVEMFLDEARIASALHHRHVAQVIELGADARSHYLVLEYLHGQHFGAVMERYVQRHERPLPPEVAAHVVACAAEGLHHAHEATDAEGTHLDLVHRDVSPHNIFVTYDGQVKITDFGIAKAAGRLTQTATGTLKGKLAYMAPEQVARGDVDRRADIFALGIVLWEATVGERLFGGGSEAQTVMRVTSGRIPKPDTRVEGYPPALQSIVLQALARRPADRYQSAEALALALRGFIATQPEGAKAEQTFVETVQESFEAERALADASLKSAPKARAKPMPVVETSRVRTRAGRGRFGLVVGTVLAALVAVVAVLVATNSPPKPEPPLPSEASPEPELIVELGVVRVDSVPSGATLTFGELPGQVTPALLEDVPYGEHELELSAPGYQTLQTTVTIEQLRTDLPLELEPVVTQTPSPDPTPPAVRGTATLHLVTIPWAKAWVNGRYLGETPLRNVDIPAGGARLQLQREGAGPRRTVRINARNGEVVRRRIEL